MKRQTRSDDEAIAEAAVARGAVDEGEKIMGTTSHRTTYTLRTLLAVAVALCVFMFAASPAFAADLIVTSNADSGEGTLRAAVDAANANAEADTITFDLPAGQRTITLASEIVFTARAQTTVDGGESGVTVSGNDEVRVFFVDLLANLSVNRMTLSDGNVPPSGRFGGGAISNDRGTVSVTDSTIRDNSAALGGGIQNFGGAVSIVDSTISGNDANSGGGVHSYVTLIEGPDTTISNTTISGNTARSVPGGAIGSGGGVKNSRGQMTISASTITGNTAPEGQAAGVETSETLRPTRTEVRSSIIAGNSTTDVDVVDGFPTIVSNGYNVIGDGNATGAFNGTGDQVIGDAPPGLGPLADNGGPTRTHALQADSPAIDAGDTDLAADQRGAPRPFDGDGDGTATDDTGSFELGPSLSINNTGVTEGDTGTVNATFTVTRSGAIGGSPTVGYATQNGSAREPGDYAATSGTLTFQSGETTKEITVPVKGDEADEADETFFVNLSNPNGATISSSRGQAIIRDDDEAPTISIEDETVTEGDSGTVNATFTVSLSEASGKFVSVQYATADNTATATSDYAATSDTLTFQFGERSKQVTVPVNGDEADEADETFFVNLSNPQNATISDDRGIGTIGDDDEARITVNPTSGLTTTEAGGTDTFTVVLDSQPTSDVTIPLTSSDTTEGTISPESLTFTPENYDTPQTVTVTGVDDDADDGDVDYEIQTEGAVSDDSSYNGLDAADVSATNADNDDPALSIHDVTVTEGDTGTTDATFTVYLDRESSQTITVDFATKDGSATDPSDYSSVSGTLTFGPGVRDRDITVPVNGDDAAESNETFTVELSNPENATISDDEGTGAITDDDVTPDTAKPTITDLRPPPGSFSNNRNRDVKATITDDRSDLQKKDMRLWVDGKERRNFTYDPATDRLVFDKMDRFRRGKHSAKIKATDGAGNEATRRWTFRFR